MPDNKKQSLSKTLLKVAGFAVVSIALTLALIALAFWIYSNNAPQFGAKVDGEARGFTEAKANLNLIKSIKQTYLYNSFWRLRMCYKVSMQRNRSPQ